MMTPAGQRWTTQQPTAPGWYWYREDHEDVYAVKVLDDLTIIFPGNECDYQMTELGVQEWQGPLTPNEATE